MNIFDYRSLNIGIPKIGTGMVVSGFMIRPANGSEISQWDTMGNSGTAGRPDFQKKAVFLHREMLYCIKHVISTDLYEIYPVEQKIFS